MRTSTLRIVAAAFAIAGVIALTLIGIVRDRSRGSLTDEAAIGRKLCASVRNGMRMDHDDLKQTANLETRRRAAASFLGSRFPDAADLVEMCTPLTDRVRDSDCRERGDFDCLARLAGELEHAMSSYAVEDP